jgi:hypothetical protein
MAATTDRRALATPAQAAEYLARSPKTLRNWRASGIGPKFSGRGQGVRYRYRDLDAWVDANTR